MEACIHYNSLELLNLVYCEQWEVFREVQTMTIEQDVLMKQNPYSQFWSYLKVGYLPLIWLMESFEKQVNAVLWLLYEKDQPMRSNEIMDELKPRFISVFEVLTAIENLVERTRLPHAKTNTGLYSLTYEARAEMSFLPEKY